MSQLTAPSMPIYTTGEIDVGKFTLFKIFSHIFRESPVPKKLTTTTTLYVFEESI